MYKIKEPDINCSNKLFVANNIKAQKKINDIICKKDDLIDYAFIMQNKKLLVENSGTYIRDFIYKSFNLNVFVHILDNIKITII